MAPSRKDWDGASRDALLEGLLGGMSDQVACIDAELRLCFVNSESESGAPVVGQPVAAWLDPQYRDRVLMAIQQARASGGTERLEVQGGVGGQRHYRVTVVATPGARGPSGCVLVISDITEITSGRAESRTNQAALQLAVEATGLALFHADYRSGTIEWSERMQELMGRQEPLGGEDYVEQLVHPEDRQLARAALTRLHAGESGGWQKHRIVRPDGAVRWVIPSGTVVRDADGRPLQSLGAFLDVTEAHLLEERLRQAERLDSLGTLTGGVAHNLNNLLAVLTPTLELLAEHVDEEGAAMLEEATLTTWRATTLIRQLMTFTRQRELAPQPEVPVTKLVHDAIEGCRRHLPQDIALEFVPKAGVVTCSCDPAGLSEVVLNLLLNARDSLTRAGTSNPRIQVEVQAEDRAIPPLDAKRRYCSVTVSDNGPGMSEEVQKRVFEPFFSTKGPGGMGLGLAISWRTVRAAGGTMVCTSSAGKGASFKILLPHASPRGDDDVVLEPASSAIKTGLTILLVDDDDAVRRATRRALGRAQHHVVEASSASQALQLAAPHFDIVLLDHFLPDRLGSELVPALRELSAGALIVLLSGDDLSDSGEADAVWAKPIGAGDLLARISALVERT